MAPEVVKKQKKMKLALKDRILAIEVDKALPPPVMDVLHPILIIV